MLSHPYRKARQRWEENFDSWRYYTRVVGVAVDDDGQGYFLNSDRSTTPASDMDAALILLFSRTLITRNHKIGFLHKVRCTLAKLLLGI